MRNLAIFVVLCVMMAVAILLGTVRSVPSVSDTAEEAEAISVPHIGRILVLNGCGISGAAGAVSDYLREQQFDVKNTGDAETWNYPYTIVISKTRDMTVARQVAAALKTDNVVMMRDGDDLYDVAVVLGSDFGERIE